MFTRITHAAFEVKDCTASARFYQDHFGFVKRMEMDSSSPGLEKIIFLTLGNTELELLQTSHSRPISGCHISLGTDAFDGDFRRLSEAGVKVGLQPVAASSGRKRAVFLGPDGEEIEIIG
ncbi:hypothetical protein SY88_01620 [Clostridiales bacterium PH28_bin88]|nr:hypothetical protein SY88_01620 [Clostridiales bacterium PH28_bin88]